jgi:hypothetical protein
MIHINKPSSKNLFIRYLNVRREQLVCLFRYNKRWYDYTRYKGISYLIDSIVSVITKGKSP